MAGEVLSGSLDGQAEDEKFGESGRNFVTAGTSAYEFPDDYSYRAEGGSLVVLDGEGKVAVVLADGAWNSAVAKGAKLKWNDGPDEDDSDAQ